MMNIFKRLEKIAHQNPGTATAIGLMLGSMGGLVLGEGIVWTFFKPDPLNTMGIILIFIGVFDIYCGFRSGRIKGSSLAFLQK